MRFDLVGRGPKGWWIQWIGCLKWEKESIPYWLTRGLGVEV